VRIAKLEFKQLAAKKEKLIKCIKESCKAQEVAIKSYTKALNNL
jgi:hypothetical protein